MEVEVEVQPQSEEETLENAAFEVDDTFRGNRHWYAFAEEADAAELNLDDDELDSDGGSLANQSEVPDLESLPDTDAPTWFPLNNHVRSEAACVIFQQLYPERASSTKSEKDNAGRISIPSQPAFSVVDSDPRAADMVEDSGSLLSDQNVDSSTAAQQQQGQGLQAVGGSLATLSHIVHLDYHPVKDLMFILFKSGSEYSVSRMKPGDFDPELSFKVSADALQKMVVAGDFVVISAARTLIAYNLHGAKKCQFDINDVLDISGESKVVYCLMDDGDVFARTVPQLDTSRKAELPRSSESKAVRIASNRERLALLFKTTDSTNGYMVEVYSSNFFNIVRSVNIQIDTPSPCMCLQGQEELIVGGRVAFSVLVINYAKSVAAKIPDCINALCIMCKDQLIVSAARNIELLDLRQVRNSFKDCIEVNEELLVENAPEVWVDSEILWEWVSQYTFIAADKGTGELLVMSESGLVTVFGPDVTRPLHSYQLPLPDGVTEVWRLDTTESGELIVTGENHVMLFSNIDKKLLKNIDLDNVVIHDVVCSQEKVYILTRERLAIFIKNDDDTLEELNGIPIVLDDLDEDDPLRLAVHENNLYLLLPQKQQILKMDLTHHDPSFTLFVQIEQNIKPRSIAVDEGNVMTGGWSYTSATRWRNLQVFSPGGELVRDIPTGDAVEDMVVCPGGGMFIRTSRGPLFLEKSYT